jgi:hypothetical protein
MYSIHSHISLGLSKTLANIFLTKGGIFSSQTGPGFSFGNVELHSKPVTQHVETLLMLTKD